MSHENIRAIEAVLAALPVEDRCTVLVISIIQYNPNALAVSLSMVAATARMSAGLSLEDRFQIADKMRDAADELERRQVVHIVG